MEGICLGGKVWAEGMDMDIHAKIESLDIQLSSSQVFERCLLPGSECT